MTLPNQPTNMTMTMVAAEVGATPPLSLGDARVRAVAGKPSGAISMSDLRGKSAYTPPTITCTTSIEASAPGSVGTSVNAWVTSDFKILGGEAPFSVVWARVSGTVLGVSGSNPPTFSNTATANWSVYATYKGTVTDNRGAVVVSPNIEIHLSGGIAV